MMKFGVALKKAREAKQLSTKDVSDAIHLSDKQVNALESHHFSALPEPMITRGFIRSYAKFLDIPHEPLLDNYRELVPNDAVSSLVVTANVNQVYSEGHQRSWLMYVLGSIVIALFLVVWYYYMDKMPEADTEISVAERNIVETTQKGGFEPITIEPQVKEAASKPITKNVDKLVVTKPAEASMPLTKKTAIEAVAVNQTDVVVAQVVAQSFNSAAEDALSMIFPEESWLSVRDQHGKVVFKQLMTAGTRKDMHITKPFKLTIGNAINVTVSYAGSMIDLSESTRSNVARVKVE